MIDPPQLVDVRSLEEVDASQVLPSVVMALNATKADLHEAGVRMRIALQVLEEMTQDGRPIEFVWAELEARVRGWLALPASGTEKGAVVDAWLASVDPTRVEAMWLSGDFDTPKGRQVIQGLRDLAAADPKLQGPE